MKIHLPNSAFLGNINPFLASFDPSEEDKLEITANEKWIFVHPVVLAMVAALGDKIEPQKITCKKIIARSGHYLERMGLYNFLGIKSGLKIEKHESAGRFIPLTRIKTSNDLTSFLTEMIPLLHLSINKAQAIQYIFSELVRNVLEHSRSEKGAIICAQYFKKSNTIRIGVADVGLGIKNTINQSYSAKNDLDAIRLALWPGITGTTRKKGGTEQNAGAGLFFIKSIANVHSDFFIIYSGNSMYKLLKRSSREKIKLKADPFKDRHSKVDTLPYWKGVIVGIDISLNESMEFTFLLEFIKDFYSGSVKINKKKKFKKANFI